MMNSPASELVLDSKQLIEFNPLPEADYPHQNWEYFDVESRGTLYAMIHTWRLDPKANERDQLVSREYIERFNDDGTSNSIVAIAPPPGIEHATFYQFGVFSGGNFLMTGSGSTKSGSRRAFTAIYDSYGRFVTQLRLPADITVADYAKPNGALKSSEANSRTTAGQTPSSNSSPQESRGNLGIEESSAQRADTSFENAISTESVLGAPDGYVYILRNSTPLKLYAVDGMGEVVRSFHLSVPFQGLVPFNMGLAGPDQLFLDFENAPATEHGAQVAQDEIVSLVNPVSGQFEATYGLPDSVKHKAILACVDQRGDFLYLGSTPDNHLAVFIYGP